MEVLKKHFSKLITNSEARFISYKKMLEDLFKSKKQYENADDFEWMRLHLRDMKNTEERFLKSLIFEWTEIKRDYGY